MNKKVYVCPSVITRDVRVSMVCASIQGTPNIEEGPYGARKDFFSRDPGFGNDDKYGIGVDNDGIWGNGID